MIIFIYKDNCAGHFLLFTRLIEKNDYRDEPFVSALQPLRLIAIRISGMRGGVA
jgi:hypothetical protein